MLALYVALYLLVGVLINAGALYIGAAEDEVDLTFTILVWPILLGGMALFIVLEPLRLASTSLAAYAKRKHLEKKLKHVAKQDSLPG
jgi:hypothetical protein